jgi:hypothetical protein
VRQCLVPLGKPLTNINSLGADIVMRRLNRFGVFG